MEFEIKYPGSCTNCFVNQDRKPQSALNFSTCDLRKWHLCKAESGQYYQPKKQWVQCTLGNTKVGDTVRERGTHVSVLVEAIKGGDVCVSFIRESGLAAIKKLFNFEIEV